LARGNYTGAVAVCLHLTAAKQVDIVPGVMVLLHVLTCPCY
jgi:hypothetical protein